MFQLSENLFRFTDTCHVYVIRTGHSAVLIDFGTGDVLDHLVEIDVTQVTAVLMTHFHRDQAQGLPRAIAEGIPVWVPHVEQDLFAQVDSHWQAREISRNYNMRQDRFALLESISIAGTLHDYATLRFGGHAFTIVPTPGHTTGSITPLANIDGQRVAFVGDLISAPGKVGSMAATQWTYNGAEGVPMTILSVLDLKEREPNLLLPSHGVPMNEPAAAIELLVLRLRELLNLRHEHRQLEFLRQQPYIAITSHLLRLRASESNTYVLISKSGKALFMDYGYDFVTGFANGTDRASRRPWLYSLPMLKRDFGVTKIEVAIPTHFHDDHVAGLNLLREVEGTQIWAAENFVDILQNPSRYDLPCLWYDPVPADKTLPLGVPIQWEEYTLTLYAQPGHTEYAVAIYFEVDRKRVLAIGDQYEEDDPLRVNYVYENHWHIGDYLKGAELYRTLAPDLILAGHWKPLWITPADLDQLMPRAETLDRLHRDLLPVESIELQSARVEIRPYRIEANAGETIDFEIEIKNPFDRDQDTCAVIVAPLGWHVEPAIIETRVQAREQQIVKFSLTLPFDISVRRARIAVDLTIGTTRFGQQAEALVSINSVSSTPSGTESSQRVVASEPLALQELFL
ncbi:MAG: MBL fold metallo-hydrolase [Chloroflexi bacterium]|nr:MBL fold metallo-hydrolase [Chloroflexota bacterium]